MSDWANWIAVGVGGMLGSMARYGLLQLFSAIGPAWLPAATLSANVLGCFAIGYVSQWAFHQQLTGTWWIVGIRVGLLGGLTTFSSFALDVLREWQNGRAGFSVALVCMHVALGLAAVAAGVAIGTQADADEMR